VGALSCFVAINIDRTLWTEIVDGP
jgi:hypothetical protein